MKKNMYKQQRLETAYLFNSEAQLITVHTYNGISYSC